MQKISEFLGDAIRRRRKELGLNQEDFGRSVGMSRTGLANLERGEVWPRLDSLEKIAFELKCHPLDFFQITPPKLNIDKEVQDAIRSEVEAALKKLGHSKKTN